MNTTEYFTNINAMFLFCIFTCGLLLAVGWKLVRKSEKLKEEQDSHLKATNTNTLLVTENKEIDQKLAESEHKLRDAEKEIRVLQAKLDHADADRIELRAERATLENKLTDALAKVRKRDNGGKFLPSGNARVRTVKKLKLVTDLGENEVIHCPTLPEAEAICRLMDEAGLTWASTASYLKKTYWHEHKEEICYCPKQGTKSNLWYFQRNCYTIHPASDFIARPKRVKKVKADLPKLVHGLTVKNPTEAEAKMIFDEAKRLGVKVSNKDKFGKEYPWIWAIGENQITVCSARKFDDDIYVTAKEFVQRMKNGRG